MSIQTNRRNALLAGGASVATTALGLSSAAAQTPQPVQLAQAAPASRPPVGGATGQVPPGPVPGTIMPDAYARIVAQFAYVWAWPMVNMHNRRTAFDQIPEPGLIGGIVPAGPVNQIGMVTDYIDPAERVVATPNQDVVYGFGILSLDREPVVVQVPDFGDRFWVFQAANQRTESYTRLGKMYGSRPGFYLLAHAGWQGQVPAGIEDVFRTDTVVSALIPRAFMDDTAEDRRAIQPLINQIMAYPLSRFTGRMQTKDWKAAPHFPAADTGPGETKWVNPDTFFETLPAVLDEVPPLPGEEAIYGQIRALLQAAKDRPALMEVLKRVANETEAGAMADLFHWRNQGIQLPHGWTMMTNPAQWGTDYLTRASAARANIFSNAPNETLYHALDVDASGARLNGANRYAITFAAGQLPPVRGFWSLTMYNETHFFETNSLNRYSLGTKNKNLQVAADGSLTLFMSNQPPADAAQRPNWLPAPRGNFSVYLRAYWPEPAIAERSWTPPAVRKQ